MNIVEIGSIIRKKGDEFCGSLPPSLARIAVEFMFLNSYYVMSCQCCEHETAISKEMLDHGFTEYQKDMLIYLAQYEK